MFVALLVCSRHGSATCDWRTRAKFNAANSFSGELPLVWLLRVFACSFQFPVATCNATFATFRTCSRLSHDVTSCCATQFFDSTQIRVVANLLRSEQLQGANCCSTRRSIFDARKQELHFAKTDSFAFHCQLPVSVVLRMSAIVARSNCGHSQPEQQLQGKSKSTEPLFSCATFAPFEAEKAKLVLLASFSQQTIRRYKKLLRSSLVVACSVQAQVQFSSSAAALSVSRSFKAQHA